MCAGCSLQIWCICALLSSASKSGVFRMWNHTSSDTFLTAEGSGSIVTVQTGSKSQTRAVQRSRFSALSSSSTTSEFNHWNLQAARPHTCFGLWVGSTKRKKNNPHTHPTTQPTHPTEWPTVFFPHVGPDARWRSRAQPQDLPRAAADDHRDGPSSPEWEASALIRVHRTVGRVSWLEAAHDPLNKNRKKRVGTWEVLNGFEEWKRFSDEVASGFLWCLAQYLVFSRCSGWRHVSRLTRSFPGFLMYLSSWMVEVWCS